MPLHLSAKKQVGALCAGDVPCSLKSSAVLNVGSFHSREIGNRMRRGEIKQKSGNVMLNNLSILIYRLKVTLSSQMFPCFFPVGSKDLSFLESLLLWYPHIVLKSKMFHFHFIFVENCALLFGQEL